MSEYLNRKKVRESLIQYFKTIAKCQKRIQSIQQQLISHPRFNPIQLYKKISSSDKMTTKDLKSYFTTQLKIERQEAIRLYFIKYQFASNRCISLEQFLQTLIPHTPNHLRESLAQIQYQLQTKHLDMTVSKTYKNLILTTLQNLFLILLLQRQIRLDSWEMVKDFMLKDILWVGKLIDQVIQEEVDVIYIRKWMELWTNVDQYMILNLMRFFKGGHQAMLKAFYQHNIAVKINCTCSRSFLVEEYERGVQGSRQNKVDGKSSTSSKKLSKVSIFRWSSSDKKNNINSSLKKNQNNSKQQFRNEYENSKNQFQNKQISRHVSVKLFLDYVHTLIESEKQLDQKRHLLQPFQRQVQLIVNDILSKKKAVTRIQKILLFAAKFAQNKTKKIQKLLQQLGNAQISNQLVFEIFSQSLVKNKTKPNKAQKTQINSQKIATIISQILLKFIQTKLSLQRILAQNSIVSNPQSLNEIIEYICQKIDQNRQNQINVQGLRKFLEIQFYDEKRLCEKKYVFLLMNHIGDGQKVTKKTLEKVFGNKKKQNTKKNRNKEKL